MFSSSLLPVVCREALILFTLFVGVFFLRIVVSNTYYFCFVCLCLVYQMLPVSLDCSILIAPAVFSNVYLRLMGLMLNSSLNYIYLKHININFILYLFQLRHVFTGKYIHSSTTQTSQKDRNNMRVYHRNITVVKLYTYTSNVQIFQIHAAFGCALKLYAFIYSMYGIHKALVRYVDYLNFVTVWCIT